MKYLTTWMTVALIKEKWEQKIWLHKDHPQSHLNERFAVSKFMIMT